ncbi:hypothetical protein FA04_24170 (plasmid) [Ensifer adhaerens]|uniref:Alpha-2,3-sialyltransferase n=1 Tax=Ensifer adhaerens TaxID=106592 RepID=A0ABY8HLF4_ENSAD|nr:MULTISPECIES: alpha-2,3-sialyltransferase [Ensifer]ANK75770.1 hypothetical protein FA04_24170 [Ensifer adhaerens]KDP73574.1 hypothetical protein FA04_11640 [Ensifer adhaerens]WFP92922.1 alpha-2,3-sialyltransferase [Ensifer adhaerens]SFH26595.1 Alpha-2,3-sialyltransferase (CST-I) [Ensifer sp. OV372]
MAFPKNSQSVPNELERIRRYFSDRLHQDCYIVGNGPSSSEVRLSEEEAANSAIFRANWFFLEEEKRYGDRVDGFFWSVDNAGLRENLQNIQRLDRYKINAFFQPFQASDLREKVITASTADLMPNFDHWAVIASNPTLARFMMGRPLPTQGMQMIAFAAIMGFKKIHLSGIDLYADIAKRYAWDVPDTIREHLQEKDVAAGYEAKHSLDLDISFLRAIRDQYEFDLIGLSKMEIIAPHLTRTETRIAEPAQAEPDRSGNIYVTLADGRYAIGAMALARSLAATSNVPLLVLHTDPYTPHLLKHLPNVSTLAVEPIDNPHTHGQTRFAGTFTKLRVFELKGYDRVTFVDADCVVLKNIDDLFDLEGFWAAPDWGTDLTRAFNSGVFSFSPSDDISERVFSALPHSHSNDGGDQGFLNVVLSPEVQWLPVEYNTLKRLPVYHPNMVNINDVKVLHFVGDNPWDTYQFKSEFVHLENIWASFMEKEDWRHAFWMNKAFISKRWGKAKKPPQPPANSKNDFQKRLDNYDFVRRNVVKWGDKLLPPLISKPIDKALKRVGIL